MSWRKECDGTMSSRFEAVMKNSFPDIPHDIIFVFGEKENTKKTSVSCHKLFLAIASPVFETMFSERHNKGHPKVTQLVELENHRVTGKDNSVLQIDVPDLDPIGLSNVIQYAYCGKLNVDVKDCLVTMYAANKYDIAELTAHCAQLLESELTWENALTIHHAATLLSSDELKQKSWQFIEENSGAILDSKQFLEFSKQSLCEFLKFNSIGKKSELEIFQATLRWAYYQCDKEGLQHTAENVKAMLGNIIPLIRFPVMSTEEFSDFVEPCGILSTNDCSAIYKYFSFSGEKQRALSSKIKFSCEKRVPFVYQRNFDAQFFHPDTKFRFQTVLNNRPKLQIKRNIDHFSLTGCTEKLKLKSVGIIVPFQSLTKLTEVEILYYDFTSAEKAVMPTKHTKKVVSKYEQIVHIKFDNPVFMKPNGSFGLSLTKLVNGKVKQNDLIDLPSHTMKLEVACSCLGPSSKQFKVKYSPTQHLIWSLQFERALED